MKKEDRRKTDIQESWVENKTDEAHFIYEGDIVLLNNWGIDNGNQIIGVAQVVWDSEYHKWDFTMIAGSYIESEYDRWRQCPKIIGNMWDGIIVDEYKHLSISDEEKWKELLKQSSIQAEIRYEKRRTARVRKSNILKLEEKQDEIKEINKTLEKLKQQEKEAIAKIKGDKD